MHLEGRDVPDGPQAHRITGSQHMGLWLLQEGAGDGHDRALLASDPPEQFPQR